jgi:hypothetical protein
MLNLGAEIGLAEIQYHPMILSGYDLAYEEINFGTMFFIPQLAEFAFTSSMDKLGVLMFGVSSTDISFGILELEAKYNLVLPKIFPIPMHSLLADPEAAPMFNRIAVNGTEYSSNLKLSMYYFGWRK